VVVIGRGPERRALAAHSADLGVAEQVRFVGPVEDAVLFRWLRTADVVVTMATEAMSGGTLLEAACAGAPIVASDIPAHLEIAGRLGHGAVRFVSSQSSPLALADEILAAVDTPRPPPDRWRVPSWEDAARETAGLYRHASDAGSRDGRAALS
jgi:phenylacetate-CoA ligase